VEDDEGGDGGDARGTLPQFQLMLMNMTDEFWNLKDELEKIL
jgi:hypothetical protein